jgi:hypothetical protein
MAITSGTDAAKPLTGNTVGDQYFATDTGVWYTAISSSDWVANSPDQYGRLPLESIVNSKVAPEATYSGAPVWTGTTAPSGATTHSYKWSRIGSMVILNISLVYAVAGSALTQVTIPLPAGCPTPDELAGLTAASSILYSGAGYLATGPTSAPVASRAWIQVNSGDNGYNIVIVAGSTNARIAIATVTYFTS